MSYETQYLTLLRRVYINGTDRPNRTGVPARSLFHGHIEVDLAEEFPLLTTKRMAWHYILSELLWFIRGDTDIDYLLEHGVTIWNEWAKPDTNEIGRMYGYQWRHWGRDQLARVVESVQYEPHSRRHVVSAWNNDDLDDMALAPCHVLFQFYVRGDYLDIQVYQRSADMFLGVPFNLACYATLTHMVANVANYKPGKLHWIGGDCHIYNNHFEQVVTQYNRLPRPAPKLLIDRTHNNIDSFEHGDFTVVDYDPYPRLPGEVAV